MLVAVFAQDQAFADVAQALHGVATVAREMRADTLAERCNVQCPAVLVLDPSALPARLRPSVLRDLTGCPVEIVLYTPPSASVAHSLVAAADIGIRDVAMRDSGDVASQLRGAVMALGVFPVRMALLEALMPTIRRLPREVGVLVVSLFANRAVIQTTQELAIAAKMWRRTLDRTFQRAGLRSAAVVIVASRVARSWDMMDRSKVGVAQAAFASGFGSGRSLSGHFVRLTGLSPRRATHALTPDALVSRLVHGIHGASGLCDELHRN